MLFLSGIPCTKIYTWCGTISFPIIFTPFHFYKIRIICGVFFQPVIDDFPPALERENNMVLAYFAYPFCVLSIGLKKHPSDAFLPQSTKKQAVPEWHGLSWSVFYFEQFILSWLPEHGAIIDHSRTVEKEDVLICKFDIFREQRVNHISQIN